MIGSRGEVHLCSRRGRRIGIGWAHIPRTKRPDAIDGERLSACILQQSFEISRRKVVCSDESTGISGSASRELPDKQTMAKFSKIQRSQGYTPRGVQPVTMLEALQELSVGVIDIDIP